jgi:hypothetical protein
MRPDGTKLSDSHVVRRIRSVAIPPAWTDVWLSVCRGLSATAVLNCCSCSRPVMAHPRHQRVIGRRPLAGGMCCKTIFTLKTSNFDSRTSTVAQY